MKESRMKEVFDSIVRRDVPEDMNLWPRVAERVGRKNLMEIIRTRPAFALLLVLLALVLISGVAYAIGKVTGYIPGVGTVNQTASLRVLAEPVKVKQKGITVTVKQLVADADHTWISLRIDGIPPVSSGFPLCDSTPIMRLPDRTELQILPTSGNGGSGGMESENGRPMRYEFQVSYSPIPAKVKDLTLVFPCILPQGRGPENWQIPLKLSAAPPDFVTPAVEIGATFVASNPKFAITPTFEVTPVTYPSSFPATLTPVPNGSGLYLERVVELPNSYILVGNFTDAGDLPGALLITNNNYTYMPRMEDVQGNRVFYTVNNDFTPSSDWGGVYYWAYEIPKSVQWPLKITIDRVTVMQTDTTQFQFDTGPNPKNGQEWKLNLPIHLSRHDYVLDSVTMIKGGYLFKSHSAFSDLSILINSPLNNGGAVQEIQSDDGIVHTQSILFQDDSPPVGMITVDLIVSQEVLLDGPWTLTWTPPSK